MVNSDLSKVFQTADNQKKKKNFYGKQFIRKIDFALKSISFFSKLMENWNKSLKKKEFPQKESKSSSRNRTNTPPSSIDDCSIDKHCPCDHSILADNFNFQ